MHVDEEEQPLAIAFCDSPGTGICEELVFEGDLFWGTIYRNLQTRLTTRQLTALNNRRLEAIVQLNLPLVPVRLCTLICHYQHHHF